MDNNKNRIRRVAQYFHSSPGGIIINGNKSYQVMVDKFKGKELTGNLKFSELAQKNVYEMTLYGCNTAHQDYAHENVAYNLINTQKQVSRVIGWDGSMRWSYLNGEPVLANSQAYFESWLKDDKNKRNAMGRIIYKRSKQIEYPAHTSDIIQIQSYKP